jgi:hypothetical protein
MTQITSLTEIVKERRGTELQLLLRIRNFPCSNLGPVTDSPDFDSHSFP